MTDTSLEMNGESLSLQGTQLIAFVVRDKNLSFQGKRILENVYYHHELDSFSVLKDFLMRSMVILTNVIF